MFRKEHVEMSVLYCLSAVHAGSGQAIGAVDLPIQRERHTNWPHIQASGVKGAFRDWFRRYYMAHSGQPADGAEQAEKLTERVFGKEDNLAAPGAQAGAISLSDAKLLAFPVRSNCAPFVWVTCPSVLARLQRDLKLCSQSRNVPVVTPMDQDGYVPIHDAVSGPLVLEDLAVKRQDPPAEAVQLKALFQALAPQVNRLAVISDLNYSFLVTGATEIQPQIMIDFVTGTTRDGSLRYEELLPADSLLYVSAFFSPERTDKEDRLAVEIVRDCVRKAISSHIQMGGDMTLGRGLMEVAWVNGNEDEGGSQ